MTHTHWKPSWLSQSTSTLVREFWELGTRGSPLYPSYLGGWDWEDGGLRPTWEDSLWDLHLQNNKWTGGVAQMIVCLCCKCEALTSNPSPTQKKKKKSSGRKENWRKSIVSIPCEFLTGDATPGFLLQWCNYFYLPHICKGWDPACVWSQWENCPENPLPSTQRNDSQCAAVILHAACAP
jgi:hypothetical protein